MNDLEQALRILRGSISLDLGKLDADMLEALTPDEEADDGDIW